MIYKKLFFQRLLLTSTTLFILMNVSLAQISGTVKDANGELLVGVSVIQKGTTKGVVTDAHGVFSINVESGTTLQFSSVGYNDLELPAQDNMLVTMEEGAQQIDDVVVVGFGRQSKINLTGSVAAISSKELIDRPITSISSGIQGLLPGVTITSGQGRPGQNGGRIRIRGVGTYNNSDPYILIDGIESGSMEQIDPNDIESISVLKDASSAAIYGSKASNGVIMITTKRGKEGRPIISYSGNFGWQQPTVFVERMNSFDAASYYNRALVNNGKAPKYTEEELQKFKDGSDPYRYPNTDWNKLGYTGSGFQHQHNVNISGGITGIRYATSLGYLNQKGILINSGREQFNARTNLDITLSKYFTVRTNLSYINNFYQDANSSYAPGSSDQIIRQLNRIAPWIVNRYPDGTYGTIGDGNPIAWLDLGQTIDRKNQNFSGIAAVDYNIISGLKLTLQGAYVGNIQDYTAFMKDIQYNPNKYHGPNQLNDDTYLWNRITFDALLNYEKSFKEHNFKILLGHRSEKYSYKEKKSFRSGFPNNNLTDMNAGTVSTQTNNGFTRDLAMISFFGRINYDFKSKYLFEANFRADASSRFSPENRWGYFPSFSAGWKISEENFMDETKSWLQNLKIRGSWGQIGNQVVLNSDGTQDYYPWLGTYEIGKNFPFDGKVETGIAQTTYKISSIVWEKSTTWGVGLDLTVLENLNVNFDFYNRLTSDIIMNVPVPGTFGLGAYKNNVGSMLNRGIELNISYQKRWGDWNFGVNGNLALNRNRIIDYGGVEQSIDGNFIYKVGHPYKSYYIYVADGLFQSQQEADNYTSQYGNPFGKPFKAGDIRYKDVNGDGKLTSDDRDITFSEEPNFTYGLGLSAGWKGIDVSLFLQGAFGVSRFFDQEVFGEFTGDTSHPSTVWFDAWSPTNTGGKFPYVSDERTSPSHPTNVVSTFWVFKTNYLRFKNIQVGYTFPEHWMKKVSISKLRIYYSGENLFTIHNLPVNIDPEAPSGRGSHYPLISVNSIGINLTF